MKTFYNLQPSVKPSLIANQKSNLNQQLVNEEATGLLNKPFKKTIKGLVGHPLSSATLMHYSSKEIVYSFNKANNIYPLLTKTEYLLKSLFLSMYSLISRPIYLIRHDKIIIRLFVFLSPKADKYLDTSTIVKGGKLRGASTSLFKLKIKVGNTLKKIAGQRIRKFLKLKNLRPKTIEILKSQIQLTPSSLINLPLSLTSHLASQLSPSPLPTGQALKIGGGGGHALPAEGAIEGGGLETRALQPSHAHSDPKGRGGRQSTGVAPNFRSPSPSCVPNYQEPALAGEVVQGLVTYPYTSLLSHFKNRLEKLSVIFSKILKKKVEFEIIKAQLPYQDSNILAQVLGYNANNYKFRRMLKILIPRAVIKNPSKELSPPTPYPMLASLKINSGGTGEKQQPWVGWGDKDLNILLSQPSSYLPSFFYSKNYLQGLNSVWFSTWPQPSLSGVGPTELGLEASPSTEGGLGIAPEEGGATKVGLRPSLPKDGLDAAAAGQGYGLSTAAGQPSHNLDKSQIGKVKRGVVCGATIGPRPSKSQGIFFAQSITSGKMGLSSSSTACRMEAVNPRENKEQVNKQNLPSYLSGMNIKLAGRLMTQSMRPRFTVQSHQEGSLARVKVHFTEKSRFTGKNKRGAFSFTVTISHVLN